MVLHRTRDILVRQRTQIGNAIRAHMTGFGIITAKGAQNVERPKEQVDQLPQAARMPLTLLFDQLFETNKRIERVRLSSLINPMRYTLPTSVQGSGFGIRLITGE